jgi:hypothetical protein
MWLFGDMGGGARERVDGAWRIKKARGQYQKQRAFYWGGGGGWGGLSRSARPRSGIRAHTTSTHPELVQPPHPSALATGMSIGATHVAAVPGVPAACIGPWANGPTGFVYGAPSALEGI